MLIDNYLSYVFLESSTGWHAICNKGGKNMGSPA